MQQAIHRLQMAELCWLRYNNVCICTGVYILFWWGRTMNIDKCSYQCMYSNKLWNVSFHTSVVTIAITMIVQAAKSKFECFSFCVNNDIQHSNVMHWCILLWWGRTEYWQMWLSVYLYSMLAFIFIIYWSVVTIAINEIN